MTDSKNRFLKFKKSQLKVAGALMLLLIAALLLLYNSINSNQAQGVTAAQVYFEGEYRIADGDWQTIEAGKHISATQGDVTLRGNFHLMTPDGEYIGLFKSSTHIAFYTDHINLTFYEVGREPYVIDHENPLFGNSACGEDWTAHSFTSKGEYPIEIVIHNPHAFGNETAIDEMLSNVAIWGNLDFEKGILQNGESQRYIGIMFMIVSLIFLGTALFSTLIHVKNSMLIWLFGTVILFAGVYFAYSAVGVSFWSESIVSNTTLLGLSMMFYMLFLSMAIVYFLKKTKMIGEATVIFLAVANAVFLALPMMTDVFFYDTRLYWVVAQTVANIVLSTCLAKEFLHVSKKERFIYVVAFLPLLSFCIDAFGTWRGTWKGGIISKHAFVILFAVAAVMILKLIPSNINAAAKAKELEMEKIVLNSQLTETRISTMMSQIRPHFIYNTLGSIEQLCSIDPPMAGELVHNFAKYLRGNFGELDNATPIPISQEMKHVHYYVSIEKVRFPDMTFTLEMNSDDFNIPALTIQPIVENAIKHGLMKLQRGGTIHVVSYETDTHYCVSVVDDGVGFDASVELDDRRHVGLRNIRERLKVMVSGTLEIESTPNVGTKVLIKIPKEVDK